MFLGLCPSKLHKIILEIVAMRSVDGIVSFILLDKGEKQSPKNLKYSPKWLDHSQLRFFCLPERAISQKTPLNITHRIAVLMGSLDCAPWRHSWHLQVHFIYSSFWPFLFQSQPTCNQFREEENEIYPSFCSQSIWDVWWWLLCLKSGEVLQNSEDKQTLII